MKSITEIMKLTLFIIIITNLLIDKTSCTEAKPLNFPQNVFSIYQKYLNHNEKILDTKILNNYDIFTSAKSVNCSGNTCCEELQKTSGRYKKYLEDSSGNFKRSGILSGFGSQRPSDGVISQCQRAERNNRNKFGGKYCKLDQNLNGVNLPKFECVPDSCSVDDLNFVLNISEKSDELTSSYDYCMSASLEFNWWEIVGWSLIAVWSIFLLFSPIQKLKISSTIKYLLSFEQPPAALKSINGIRVLSLMWVCFGHQFLILYFSYSNNNWEIFNSFAKDNPNMILLENGTFSVDTFFAIGGLVAAYVLSRKILRYQKGSKISDSEFCFHHRDKKCGKK